MVRLPLLSSNQIIKALKRAGFQPASSNPGSHLTMKKWTGRRTIVVIVVMGKKEVPRKTLTSILRQAEVTQKDFLKRVK